MSSKDDLLLRFVGSAFALETPKVIGVAISGGSDSCAMLHLMHRWATDAGVTLYAVTVDHGLRKAAADEARAVAKFCTGLGIEHATLHWTGWDGKGNLQDQARRARYRLMADWADKRGVDTIALGHTLDDQAETFLMRLARGSGVDGLSGMQQRRGMHGITWVRPLLFNRRGKLRDYLRRHDIAWVDDPSNEDERFDRVKARKALKVLEPLGITVGSLASTAMNLQFARGALERQTYQAANEIARIDGGDVVVMRNKFFQQHNEIRSRLLRHALRWVSSAEYPSRGASIAELNYNISEGNSSTLQGCSILVSKSEFRITRELQAVKDLACKTDEIWDQRWYFSGPDKNGLEVRALGEAGLAQCPDWRATKQPRASLLATPAIWQKDRLVAAPLAGLANGWAAKLENDAKQFYSSILSH